MSKAQRFNKVHQGVFARRGESGTSVRYSTFLRALKKPGRASAEAIAAFEADKATAAVCPTHGPIADPIVGIVDKFTPDARIAFACPLCSSPDVRAQWEKEGLRS